MKRPWQVWLVFVVCVLGAAGAMAWLTQQALRGGSAAAGGRGGGGAGAAGEPRAVADGYGAGADHCGGSDSAAGGVSAGVVRGRLAAAVRAAASCRSQRNGSVAVASDAGHRNRRGSHASLRIVDAAVSCELARRAAEHAAADGRPNWRAVTATLIAARLPNSRRGSCPSCRRGAERRRLPRQLQLTGRTIRSNSSRANRGNNCSNRNGNCRSNVQPTRPQSISRRRPGAAISNRRKPISNSAANDIRLRRSKAC